MYLKKPQNSHCINIKLPDCNQRIIIGSKLQNWFLKEISYRNYSNCILFIDKNFANLYKDWFIKLKCALSPSGIIFIEPNEKSKSLKFLNSALEKCFKVGINRKSCIVAIGGGIVGDTAGFFASVYMRGVDFIFIPTTLMAQADTIINKVAISYKLLKNIIGSFYSPVLTVCDVDFLQTLPKKEISLGLSEVVKHSIIDSSSFFQYLKINLRPKLFHWKKYPWKEIVYKSLLIKSKLVVKDPFDKKGYHKGLSYGHTFANIFEGLSKFKFRHGEAVALGMHVSALISFKLGILSAKEFEQQKKILKIIQLPFCLPSKIENDIVINLLRKDKICTDNNVTIVGLVNIGKFKVCKNIDLKIIESVLNSI